MTEWQEGYREGIRDVLRELIEWCSVRKIHEDDISINELVEYLEKIKSLKL